MSGLAVHPLAKVFEREIQRFVAAAADHGGAQLYRNRRAAARIHRSWPLLITRLGRRGDMDISGTLHDVSSGGIGFYCDHGFPVGALLGIKLFWSDPNTPRVPALVCHNQVHQEGILVGARFVVHDAEACALIDTGADAWYG